MKFNFIITISLFLKVKFILIAILCTYVILNSRNVIIYEGVDMKNSHLTLDDRFEILAGLNNGENFTTIGKSLNKSANTIRNEVKNHSKKIYPSTFNGKVLLNIMTDKRKCVIIK